jgi:hypothetical protein
VSLPKVAGPSVPPPGKGSMVTTSQWFQGKDIGHGTRVVVDHIEVSVFPTPDIVG